MIGHQAVSAHHNLPLVLLSVAISLLGAYAYRELSEIFKGARGWAWLGWLAAAAIADAIGTWSMHYTGKLALRLPAPVLFDWRLVLLSWVIGVIGSAAALLIVGRSRPSWQRAIVAGLCLGGVGISGMHYTAMAAMRLPGLNQRHYSTSIVTLSIVLAIVFSTIAIRLTFRAEDGPAGRTAYHGAMLVRGMANPAMHYLAMAGVVFLSSAPTDLSHAVDVFSLGVVGISVVPVMGMVVAIMASLLGRLQTQRALLGQLFEQAPQAVALINSGDRVIRVNREFIGLFGYGPSEVVGKHLSEVIGGEETIPDEARRVEAEGIYHRKDGSPLHVSTVRVPVSLPDGKLMIYAIFVDISDRKKAEEALRLYPRRLLEAQENERRAMARELHDEVGQVLTSLGLMLGMIPRLSPEQVDTRLADAQTVLDHLIGQVRNLALDLRPAALDDLGLSAALISLFARYTSQTGVRVQFQQHGLEERRFNAEIEITAYRIIQEGLTNIARHAGVRDANVRVWAEQNMLRIAVEDRGAGFDVPSGLSGGLGLAGMRQRVSVVSGRLIVESTLGAGTRIAADVPLPG